MKHETGLFDTNVLNGSIEQAKQAQQATINKKVEERIAQNTNPLYKLGKGVEFGLGEFFDSIKGILIAVIGGLILLSIVKMT